jgi:competence protein ComEA
VLAALWGWRWGRPIGRAVIVVGALVVLAAIGRSTLAGAAAPTPMGDDAGARDPPIVASAPIVAAAPVEAPVALPAEPPRRGPASPEDPVVLNQATQDDLQRLPGIGAKRAQSILQLRAKLGRFKQVEDLMKVRGIGRVTLKRLRPLVRLDPPAVADAGAG